MKLNSSSLHQIIHDAPNKTVFTNKISHKPILIVLPKRDYISIVQDERMNHGNWDYIYKALRVVCDAKPLLNLTNHEKNSESRHKVHISISKLLLFRELSTC